MADDKAEVQRILELLRTLIRILGLPNREVERRLQLTPSYLSRLFGGYIEVKLEHVIAICRALGIHPSEFFRFAYPDPIEPPTESARKVLTMLQSAQPKARPAETPPAPPPGLSKEEVERRVQEALQKVFQELGNSG
jgi:transcriptional regulator with XRE-family HTH domain